MRRFVMVMACLVARHAGADSHAPLVEVSGDSEVDVAELDPEVGQVHLCTAPCDVRLAAGRTYVVAGPGITPSQPFRMPHADSIQLDVETGSPRAKKAGEVLGVAGGLVLGAGLYVLANRDEQRLGATVALTAVPLLVGAALLVHHGETTVTLVKHHGTRVALDTRRGALTF